MRVLTAFAMLLLAMPAMPQNFIAAPREFVSVLPMGPAHVVAGRPAVVEVHLRIANGMHVNSHTPSEDYLIPTTITPATAAGVQWGAVEYPAGEMRNFAFSATEKFSVYTGDVTLRLRVTARAGEHATTATLRYQACDNRACYPPKNLPVQLMIVAK